MKQSRRTFLCAVGIAMVCSALTSAAVVLQVRDVAVEEGDRGIQVVELEPFLQDSAQAPLVVSYFTTPHTAIASDDYLDQSGSLVFVPGRQEPGLPTPEEASDPYLRQLQIAEGYGIDVLAELDHPVGLAIAPEGSRFGKALFVGCLDQNGIGVSDYVMKVSLTGEVEDFARLFPEADPTCLEFPPAGSRFGDFLYLSANNRDGDRPGDQGGTIQRVDVDGTVIDFTSVGIPFGPGEPGEFVFTQGSDFGDQLFLVNSVGTPGDLLSVEVDGSLRVRLDDGWFENDLTGWAFRSLAWDRFERFGGGLLLGEFGRQCQCLHRFDGGQSTSLWLDDLPGRPQALVFAPEGMFGGDLFVAVDDGSVGSILRVQASGEYTVFLDGLLGFLDGNGKDVIEFSRDGSVMYVADYFANRVYQIAPSSLVEISVVGDRIPESDEVFLLQWTFGLDGQATEQTSQVTIVNDDEGDLPPELKIEPLVVWHEDAVPETLELSVRDDFTIFDTQDIEASVSPVELLELVSLSRIGDEQRFAIALRSRPDAFGIGELSLSVLDEGGNRVRKNVAIEVIPVNDRPTLDPIGDLRLGPDQMTAVVALTGIGSGAANEADELRLTVESVSAADELVLEIDYTSPGEHAELRVSKERLPLMETVVEVKATLADGQQENGSIEQYFRVTLEPPPPPIDDPPTVSIVSPDQSTVFAANGVSGETLTSLVVQVSVGDDRGVERVELLVDGIVLGELTGLEDRYVWADVPVGDYQLTARAYDTVGQTALSLPVEFSVVSRGGSVAVVRNSDDREIDKVREALAEMGRRVDLFWEHEVSVASLGRYDLVIWDLRLEGGSEVKSGHAIGALSLSEAGLPLYFIGEAILDRGRDMPPAEESAWVQVTGVTPIDALNHQDLVPDIQQPGRIGQSPAEIVAGTYGDVEGLTLDSMNAPFRLVRVGEVVGFTGALPIMAVFPDSDELGEGQGRTALQTFSVCHETEEQTRISRVLFQNTVCWLTGCPGAKCEGGDLMLLPSREDDFGGLNGELHYGALAVMSGSCPAEDVVMAVEIPENLRFVSAFSQLGSHRLRGDGVLEFMLGYIPPSGQIAVDWVLAPAAPLSVIPEVVATVRTSNLEEALGNNRFQWSERRPIRPVVFLESRYSLPGRFELRVLGEPGQRYSIGLSHDLTDWEFLRIQLSGEWDEINVEGTGSTFFGVMDQEIPDF